MTVLDYIILAVVGIAAIGGFQRGLVQELLSMAAWVLAIFAIRVLHTPFTAWLNDKIGEGISMAILAFALLLLIPYAAMKIIAGNIGEATRRSVLGPIDRVLGLGFGTIKGVVIAVVGFSLVVLGYDTVWGDRGRPEWMIQAKSYDFVEASSRSLVEMVAERRARLRGEDTADQ